MGKRQSFKEGRSTLVLDFDFSNGFNAESASAALYNRFGDDINLDFKGSGRKDFQVKLDASRWAIAKLIIKFLVKGPYNVIKYVLKKVVLKKGVASESIIEEVVIADNASRVMREALCEDPDLYEAQWSAAVTRASKYHPPEGTFNKSASAIASQLAGDSDSLKQAMSRLNFYINRAGSNLSAERRKTLDQAKKRLRDMMGGGK